MMGEGVRRALVADDVVSNRRLAAVLLDKLGWEAIEADCGEAVLARLAVDTGLDLLLLDISMPDLGGEDLCLQLRALPQYAALPIIAYTGHALQADLERFLAIGFSAVLVKPITLAGLQAAIARALPDSA